jgi:chemotaxis protein CheD
MAYESPTPRLFLHPAEAVFLDSPAQVHTVLGSCVAVTMRVPRLGLAATSHSLLPRAGSPAVDLPAAQALRYVDTAIELLLQAFTERGASAREIEVKLFGGADDLSSEGASGAFRVGMRNVAAALETLETNGLAVAAGEVGGRQGRVIDFDTETGEVVVRRLPGRLRWSRGQRALRAR